MLHLLGCATIITTFTDASDNPQVRHHIGRRFVLKEDLYLIKRDGIPARFPLLDAPRGGPLGLANPRLPGPVATELIGYKDGALEVLGIWPRGTSFHFESIWYYRTQKSAYFFIYLVSSDSQNPRAEFRLGAGGGISAASKRTFGQDPWFFDHYAQEVTR